MLYDVVIIGAGVIGCSIARELARFNAKIAVIEKEYDVCCGTSRANSGIVHAGYDAKPNTLKAKFNVEGQRMFDKLSQELNFPFARVGAMVLAFDQNDFPKLEKLLAQGKTNGLTNIRIIEKHEINRLEPNISKNAFAALLVSDSGVVCPFSMTIAYAENAANNGVHFIFNNDVQNIKKNGDFFEIISDKSTIKSKILINSAGVYSDNINNMISSNKIKIVPRKGEYCLLDREEYGLVNRTIFQLPTKMGKGVLVTPTADGHILLGPTSVDVAEKDNTDNTIEGISEILSKVGISVNNISTNNIITTFAGLRAHICNESEESDFIIEQSQDVANLINLCGIESPGLTSAPAIGAYVSNMVADLLDLQPNNDFNPTREKLQPFREMTLAQRKEAVAQNADYGQIICRCESVTKAEILDALQSPFDITELDSLKRRTRIGTGRCQGGFCSIKIPEIVAQETGTKITNIKKAGVNTNLLLSKIKAE